MFQLTFCYPPNSPFTLNFDSPTLTGLDLKHKLSSRLPGVEVAATATMRLVCGGRVVQDHVSLEGQGIADKSKIYISIGKLTAASPPIPQAKKPESDPLMAPLLKFLSDNPELYQQMLLSNPQMQQLLEKNPELRHALSDPSTLKSMLTAASNPTAYNEMLRGHDRAMSNLENIPEGFSHLKKIYSNLQEPMYDALTPVTSTKSNDLLFKGASVAASTDRMTTREPIPNPWAPRLPIEKPSHRPTSGSNPVFGFKGHPRKRKHSSSPSSPSSPSSSFELEDEIQEQEELLGKLNGSMDAMRLLSPLGVTKNHPISTEAKAGSSIDPNERFHSELEVLHQLGFEDDEGENIPALQATEGHISAAIDRILQRRGI